MGCLILQESAVLVRCRAFTATVELSPAITQWLIVVLKIRTTTRARTTGQKAQLLDFLPNHRSSPLTGSHNFSHERLIVIWSPTKLQLNKASNEKIRLFNRFPTLKIGASGVFDIHGENSVLFFNININFRTESFKVSVLSHFYCHPTQTAIPHFINFIWI